MQPGAMIRTVNSRSEERFMCQRVFVDSVALSYHEEWLIGEAASGDSQRKRERRGTAFRRSTPFG
jgi:hypothetical protein